MKKTTKIVIKSISLIILFVLLPFLNAQATEINNPINEYDSMYRCNALENHTSFYDTINIKNNSEEKSFKNIEILTDVTKELQDITKKQDFSTEQIENTINTLKNKNEIQTFLIGNDLGTLRFQLIQIKGLTSMLDILVLKTEDNAIKIQIDDQVKSLKEEQKKVESFVLEQKSKFSLFGWLVTSL